MTSPPEENVAESLLHLDPVIRNVKSFEFSIGQVKVVNFQKERLDSLSTLTLHTENIKANNAYFNTDN
jgi:hypothetical protein